MVDPENVGLTCEFVDGRSVSGFRDPKTGDCFWIFTREGIETKIKLSHEAMCVMTEMWRELVNKGGISA